MTGTKEAYSLLTTEADSEFLLRREEVLGHTVENFTNLPPNLRALLERSADLGDRPYLIAGDSTYSFREHHRIVRNLAAILASRYGIRKGDRIAIFARNCPEWIMAFWAAVSIGAVVVAGNSLGVARELDYQLELTGAKLVLADSRLGERLRSCRLSGCVRVDLGDLVSSASEREEVAAPSTVPVNLDDPAVIMFTSGTTGRPKGATHSHRNVLTAVWFHRLNDAMATATGKPPTTRRFLLSSPIFHIASLHNLAITRLATGDTVVVLLGRFDARHVLELIDRHAITNWGTVPTMINRVLREDVGAFDTSSLRALTVNSAPSSSALQKEIRTLLPHVDRGLGTSYGLTESSTAVTIASPQMLARDSQSVGRPIVTMEVQVRDAAGRVLDDGTEGEIHIRGPLVMLGYWGEGVNSHLDTDGWFATGDLGYFSNGELRMRSRRTDLILRGGENVYPAEVEGIIDAFPGVVESYVVGLPDEDYGESVAAFVVVEDLDGFDEGELLAFIRERLAAYKCPTVIDVTDEELPKNATGKVLRRKLDFGVFEQRQR